MNVIFCTVLSQERVSEVPAGSIIAVALYASLINTTLLLHWSNMCGTTAKHNAFIVFIFVHLESMQSQNNINERKFVRCHPFCNILCPFSFQFENERLPYEKGMTHNSSGWKILGLHLFFLVMKIVIMKSSRFSLYFQSCVKLLKQALRFSIFFSFFLSQENIYLKFSSLHTAKTVPAGVSWARDSSGLKWTVSIHHHFTQDHGEDAMPSVSHSARLDVHVPTFDGLWTLHMHTLSAQKEENRWLI